MGGAAPRNLALVALVACCVACGAPQNPTASPDPVRMFGGSYDFFTPGLQDAVLASERGLVITSGPDGVCFHTLYDRAPLGCPITSPVGQLALSHDESRLAVGMVGEVGLWSLDEGRWLLKIPTILGQPGRDPYRLVFSEDDQALVVMRWSGFEPLSVFEVETGEAVPLGVGIQDAFLIPWDVHVDGALVVTILDHIYLFDPVQMNLRGLSVGRMILSLARGRGPSADALFLCHNDGVSMLQLSALRGAARLDAFSRLTPSLVLAYPVSSQPCSGVVGVESGEVVIESPGVPFERVDPSSGLVRVRSTDFPLGEQNEPFMNPMLFHASDAWLMRRTSASLWVRDADTLNLVDPPPHHTLPLTELAVSRDYVVSTAQDGVGVWERGSETLAFWLTWEGLSRADADAELHDGAQPYAVAITENEAWLAVLWNTFEGTGVVRFYHLPDGARASRELELERPGTRLGFVGEEGESVVVALDDGTIEAFHVSTGSSWVRFESQPQVQRMAISGMRVVTQSERGHVRSWDLEGGAQTMLPLWSSVYPIGGLTAERIAAYDTNQTHINVLGIPDGEKLGSFALPPQSYATAVALSPDGALLAMASPERLQIGSVGSGEILGDMPLPEYATHMSFTPESDGLLIGGASGAMWMVPDLRVLRVQSPDDDGEGMHGDVEIR